MLCVLYVTITNILYWLAKLNNFTFHQNCSYIIAVCTSMVLMYAC